MSDLFVGWLLGVSTVLASIAAWVAWKMRDWTPPKNN